MQKLLPLVRKRKKTFIFIAVLAAIALYFGTKGEPAPTWTTDTVTRGTVQQIVSVSGTVHAVGSADLAFPVSGIIERIHVSEGMSVMKGDVLATLAHDDLNADYQDAEAALLIAKANQIELIQGQRAEARDVSKTTADIAREELARVTAEQDERVASAYRTLLSSDLAAVPEKSDNEDVPPTITGTYTCEAGTYFLDIFSSKARSGISYALSGLEKGTFTAYMESSAPMGACGLRIQFDADENYASSRWIVAVPNTESASYLTNLNAYNLAVTSRTNAIRAAEQKLTLAEQTLALDTAAPRNEALMRAEAEVLQAEAQLRVARTRIDDHILTAPFDGTITNVEPLAGEAIQAEPIITILSPHAYELTALIPEIDITKVRDGQKAQVVFDARADEIIPATITFISPLAEEVDGVSYFEAKLALEAETPWLRSGLNADIDIIVESHDNVTRLPKRYVIENDGSYTVQIPQGEASTTVPIEVLFKGNDGFVEVANIQEGTTVIAP